MNIESQVTQAMQSIPWFREIKPVHFGRLAQIARLVEVAEGKELFNEGDVDNHVYIVVDGRMALEMFIPHRGRVRILTVEAMDLLGWSSVTPVVHQRTASARAVVKSRLLAFDSEKLRQLCDEDQELGYAVMRRVANIIASRLLVTRLQLLDMFAQPGEAAHVD